MTAGAASRAEGLAATGYEHRQDAGVPASNNHFVLEPASGIRDKATAEEEH